MNKVKNQKGKLKTLPNELNTEAEQFFFQSTNDEHYNNKINLASPTFASTELISVDDEKENCKLLGQKFSDKSQSHQLVKEYKAL